MASVVQAAQSTGTAVYKGVVLGSAATAGNLLVQMVTQTATATAPTGESGWTVSAIKQEGATANINTWMLTKTAAGGEKEIVATAAAGGTIGSGMVAELNGVSSEPDEHVGEKYTSATSMETPELTTPSSGDVILAWFAGFTQSTGGNTAWSGTPTLTTGTEATGRGVMGYAVASGALSKVRWKLTWTTAKASEVLVVAFKPSAAGVQIPLNAAASTSAASATVTAPTQVPLSAAASSSAASAEITAPTQIPLSAAASTSAAQATVTAATQIALSPAASTSAASTLPALVSTLIPLLPAAATSAASLIVTAATQVPLSAAKSTSAATMALSAATKIALSPAASASSAQMALSAATLIPLSSASSISSAGSLTITFPHVGEQFPTNKPIPGFVTIPQRGRLSKPQAGRFS